MKAKIIEEFVVGGMIFFIRWMINCEGVFEERDYICSLMMKCIVFLNFFHLFLWWIFLNAVYWNRWVIHNSTKIKNIDIFGYLNSTKCLPLDSIYFYQIYFAIIINILMHFTFLIHFNIKLISILIVIKLINLLKDSPNILNQILIYIKHNNHFIWISIISHIFLLSLFL